MARNTIQSLLCLAFVLCGHCVLAVTIPNVPVGNPGNHADALTYYVYGGVSYNYRIATTEVTNAQYAEFLSAKAVSDSLDLYNTRMGSNAYGGITRSGSDGSYTYAPKADMGNKPVNYVSWYDAIRFANWLHNGQGAGDTETGAYTLLGGAPTPTNGLSITRNAGATWFLTSENEWYKAAYYDATIGDYWEYPTRSDSQPTVAGANSVGDISNPGKNVANYFSGADWNGQDGNVTTVGSAGPLSKSYYGTSDQGGNVWEWNEALTSGSYRGWRGESFNDASGGAYSVRIYADPTLEFSSLGFRVATVPEPTTVVLFGVALAAMLGSLSQRSNSRRTGRRTNHRHAVRRPSFEPLEDRRLLSFSPAISYATGAAALVTEVVTADFNNDGLLDLAATNVYSQVNVLLGNGAGGFAAAQQFNPGGLSLAAGDLNKDGKIDLVTANHIDGRVGILFGKGDGTFQPVVTKNTSGYPLAVAVADFNADGNLDIVVIEDGESTWVQVLLGNGAGGFTAKHELGVYALAGLAVGDLNGDGMLDVVMLGSHLAGQEQAQGGQVLLGRGDGTFRYAPYLYTGPDPLGVAIADFTGDGKPDLLVAAQDVELIRGYGDGSFDVLVDGYTANGAAHAGVATGDFNADGKLDAVVSDLDTNTVSMMLGNADGTLRYAGAFAAGQAPTDISVGDFNRDGRLDVAVTGFNSASSTVSILLNDGNWPATSPALPGDYNGSGAVDAADYIVWRKMLGSSVPKYSGADGSGNGVIDQDDHAVWRAHFGETLSAVGAGRLVAAANAATPELSASVESVVVTEQASASIEPAEPDERGSIEPQGTSARDSALAVLDSRLAQFVPQGKATMRRPHALSTTDSGMKARGNDLLLVRSSAARFDQQPSESGRNSRLINDSSEEAVEKRREALDIAFTTLKHAKWQIGGNMLRRVWAGLCAGLVTLALQSSCAASATIYNLGTLGGTESYGYAINANGQVAGYSTTTGGELRAFLYTVTPGSDGAMADLGTLHDTALVPGSIAYDINASGQVVGDSDEWETYIPRAFLYTGTPDSGGGMADIGDLFPDAGGTAQTHARGINASGQIVGFSGVAASGNSHAFLYTGTPGSGGAMVDLGTLTGPDGYSRAYGINAGGQVVGDSAAHAFLYTGTPGSGGAMADLGTLPGKTYSQGLAINDVGQVVGCSGNSLDTTDTTQHAFLYSGTPGSGGAMADLGTLGGTYSVGGAINISGQVVGHSSITAGGAQHAFLYTGIPGVDGHMIDLDAWLDANNPIEGAKWTLTSAAGVTDTGLITGEGNYNDGPGGLTDGTRAILLDASALVSTSLPGDYNHDGKVDAADYVVWRKSNGSQSDYNTWRSHFGQPAGSGAALPSAELLSAAVPEPTTLILMILAAVGWSFRRRRAA